MVRSFIISILNLLLAILWLFVLVPTLSSSLNTSSPWVLPPLCVYREQSYSLVAFVCHVVMSTENGDTEQLNISKVNLNLVYYIYTIF